MIEKNFVRAEELARRYGVSTATIHAWNRHGLIPSLRASQRPVLFDPTEVDRALRDRGCGNGRHQPPDTVTSSDIQQQWLFCPWCGCHFPKGVTSDNGCDACRSPRRPSSDD
jgi:hypothetical protein